MRKYAPYILLTAAVILPLLLPGYLFMLDWVVTPDLPMPAAVGNDYLWHMLLYLLDVILPSQFIQKAILISIPLLSAIGMHRLLEYLADPRQQEPSPDTSRRPLTRGKRIFEPVVSSSSFPAPLRLSLLDVSGLGSGLSWYWAIYIAGIFYAVNPFTYSRFMAGQYAVLLGYALVPFFARALLAFLAAPTSKTLFKATGVALLISIISIHTLGSIGVITLVLLGMVLWRHRKRDGVVKGYLLLCLAGVGIFIAASSYWLIPLLLGRGDTAQLIQQFDSSHAEAFATAGSNIGIQIFNVLNLQGFWWESSGQYLLPQDRLVGWGTIRLFVWALAGWGIIVCWQRARSLAIALISIGILGLIFAAGFPEPVLTAVGYREPQKFAGLVALVFAVGIGFGSARLLHKIRQRSELQYGLSASALLVIILLFTPTMYWGFARQFAPRHYPDDWHALNTRLTQDPDTFQTLFLPWHQYMSFDFAGRIIANPAEQFFDTPVIASHNPELGGIRPRQDTARKDITALLSGKDKARFGDRIAGHNVKYIILAKEFDYRKYQYLDDQPTLVVVWETPALKLYRNTDYRENR